MASHFQLLLGRAVADPDRPISQLDLLGDEERRLVVEEWNRTDADYPRERGLHELFEEQAERTPEAMAGVGGVGDPQGGRPVPAARSGRSGGTALMAPARLGSGGGGEPGAAGGQGGG